MHGILHYMLIAGCVLVALAGLFVSVIFCAFSDSPDANRAVQRALTPTAISTAVAFCFARHWVLHPTAWWSYVFGFVALASPPVFLIGLTLLLIRWRNRGW